MRRQGRSEIAYSKSNGRGPVTSGRQGKGATASIIARPPTCRRNALPSAAAASFSSRILASPAKTSGGHRSSSERASLRAFSSGYSGCCQAFLDCQLDGDHRGVSVTRRSDSGAAEVSVACAHLTLEHWRRCGADKAGALKAGDWMDFNKAMVIPQRLPDTQGVVALASLLHPE